MRPCYCDQSSCRSCYLYHTDERYFKMWGPTLWPYSAPAISPTVKTKYAVVVLAVGEHGQNLLNISGESLKNYAAKIGADFHVIDGPISQVAYPQEDKFQISSYLDYYERIIYFDADIIVQPDAPNLFALVPEDELGICVEEDFGPRLFEAQDVKDMQEAQGLQVLPIENYCNSGLMVISRKHKRVFLPPEHPYRYVASAEQHLVNARIVEYGVPIFHLSPELVWIYFQDQCFKHKIGRKFLHYAGAATGDKDVAAMMRGHEPVKVFSSFGDLGDTIYQMPAMQLMGGGELVFYPVNSKVREPWTRKKVEQVRSFFESLPYVKSVRFENKPEGIVLDQWRTIITPRLTIADLVCDVFNLPHWPLNEPWAKIEHPQPVANYVFHRSPRYQNPQFPWRQIVKLIGKQSIFVGSTQEHEAFVKDFGTIRYYPTPTLLDLARVIAGCKMFIGNQSAPRAIAEALKKPVWQESGNPPNCFFERSNAWYLPNEWPIEPFDAVYEKTLLGVQRLRLLTKLARETSVLPGEMAELGTYMGGSAMAISLAAPNKTLHVFDNFEGGIPETDIEQGGHRKGDFSCPQKEVEKYLAGRRVRIHPGVFPGTTKGLEHLKFSFVHYDGDTRQSTQAALEYFLPRLLPGGVIVFDDWGHPGCIGVAKVVKEFGLDVVVGEDSQAWYRKPKE